MNKLFIITGASSGIGLALGNRVLQEKDYWVIGISRRQSIYHPRYAHIKIDLRNCDELSLSCLNYHLSKTPSKHVLLINNAGTVDPIGYVGEIDSNTFLDSVQVNCISPFLITNMLVKESIKKGFKLDVMNIGTGASQKPIDGWSAYCSSKAALSMLTKVWALEAEKTKWNIRFMEFSPGVIDTEMQKSIRETGSQNFSLKEKFVSYHVKCELENPSITAQKILSQLEGSL